MQRPVGVRRTQSPFARRRVHSVSILVFLVKAALKKIFGVAICLKTVHLFPEDAMKLTATLRLLLFLAFVWLPAEAQFGEIASLVSGLIGSGALGGLGNLGGLAGLAGSAGSAGAAAGAAAGALSNAGTLYQLAQTALQLTGTGVQVLNQASEGAWFPAVVEQAAKNQKEFQEKLLAANTNPASIPLTSQGLFPQSSGKIAKGRELTVGPEFGTHFPAPDDYDGEDKEETSSAKPKTVKGGPDVAENIDEKPSKLFPEDKEEVEETTPSSTTTLTTTTTSSTAPEEVKKEVAPLPAPRRRIRVEIPENKKDEDDSDYYDSFKTDSNTDFVFSEHLDEEEEPLLPSKASNAKSERFSVSVPPTTQKSKARKAPDLSRLVEILKQSNLEESEINEIISQVEVNKNTKPREKWPSTTIPNSEELDPQDAEREEKRRRILEAHRRGIASATRLSFRPSTTTFASPVRHRKVTNPSNHKNVTIVPRFVRPKTTVQQTEVKRWNTTTIPVERGRILKKINSLADLRARAFSVQSQVNSKIHSTNSELRPIHSERYLVDANGKPYWPHVATQKAQQVVRPQQVIRSQQVVPPQQTAFSQHVPQQKTFPPARPTVVYPTVTTTTAPFYYNQRNLGFYQQFSQQPHIFYNMFSYPSTNTFQPSIAQSQNPFAPIFTPQPQATAAQFGMPSFPQTG
ncbi:hypothetical protein L596_015115 [Steinernema carpocapsae]|uniref:Uncharacterized protein n=1 Tax=Steinernema carpocapsae TaxID=34508 RepID=A0A4U5NFA5_STECR|nr:hypothetical protein L596_015115 [Steinernema carpocapsae]